MIYSLLLLILYITSFLFMYMVTLIFFYLKQNIRIEIFSDHHPYRVIFSYASILFCVLFAIQFLILTKCFKIRFLFEILEIKYIKLERLQFLFNIFTTFASFITLYVAIMQGDFKFSDFNGLKMLQTIAIPSSLAYNLSINSINKTTKKSEMKRQKRKYH